MSLLQNRNDFYHDLVDRLQSVALIYHLALQRTGSDADQMVKQCISELQLVAEQMEHYRKTPRIVNG